MKRETSALRRFEDMKSNVDFGPVIRFVELHVDVRNTKGVNMWEKSGFETYQLKMKKQLN
jgi:hypothetical protein